MKNFFYQHLECKLFSEILNYVGYRFKKLGVRRICHQEFRSHIHFCFSYLPYKTFTLRQRFQTLNSVNLIFFSKIKLRNDSLRYLRYPNLYTFSKYLFSVNILKYSHSYCFIYFILLLFTYIFI